MNNNQSTYKDSNRFIIEISDKTFDGNVHMTENPNGYKE